ncbi:hypothetical protein SLA2020_185970 [Shorea laevis]
MVEVKGMVDLPRALRRNLIHSFFESPATLFFGSFVLSLQQRQGLSRSFFSMEYQVSDSSGTDDDVPPSHQNIVSGGGYVSGNGRSAGRHALVYDINTPNETWEWVDLKEIPPEDI